MENSLSPHRRTFLKKIALLTGGGLLSSFPLRTSGLGNSMRNHKGKFVPVMLTPFKTDSSIDFDGLSQLVDFYFEAGAEGFFANCLSSEMYHLSDAERLAITDHVVKRVAGRASVVATGSFGKSLEEKAAFTKSINDTGVESVILISSHFVEREEADAVLIDNIEQFLELTGSIPLGTYECPSPYKRVISPDVYSFLLATGRFFYHKDTTESMEAMAVKLKLSQNSSFELYNAHSGTAAACIRAGAAGMSPISGNFYPEIISWICKNATDPRKQKDVEWIQSEILQTERTISTIYPVSAKYFLKKRGLAIQEVSRSNNRELTIEHRENLDQVYSRFLGWCDRLGIAVVR